MKHIPMGFTMKTYVISLLDTCIEISMVSTGTSRIIKDVGKYFSHNV